VERERGICRTWPIWHGPTTPRRIYPWSSAPDSSILSLSAFRWDRSDPAWFPITPCPARPPVWALAVSNDGSVVVGTGRDRPGGSAAFVLGRRTRCARELKDVLTETGLDPRELGSLNDAVGYLGRRGLRIVGTGIGPYGPGAWIATIPEPGTGLLVIAGLLGLAGWRRGAPTSASRSSERFRVSRFREGHHVLEDDAPHPPRRWSQTRPRLE